MTRWDRLTEFLALAPDPCTLSMSQLEDIVGVLPQSARVHRAWWSGDRPQVHAWRAAGYVLDQVALGREVTLRRDEPGRVAPEPAEPRETITPEPEARREPGRSRPDVILVSCSARKGGKPAPAKNLYTSPRFAKQRAYAEASGAPWFILSAEHALVAPDEWLAPYDRYLPDTPPTYRAAWGSWVAERLELLVGPLQGLEIEIHAPAAYAEACSPQLKAKGTVVTTPLAGLRQGEQLAFYSDVASAKNVQPLPDSTAPDPGGYIDALLRSDKALTPAEFLAQDPGPLRIPGLYSWWVDEAGADDLSRAAGVVVEPGLIYAGLAGATRWPSGKRSTNTLWSRIAGMHLGANHEFSTFRRSLGALETALQGDDTVDEASLTAWMHAHLKVIPVPYEDADSLGTLETLVLSRLDPPLNLRGMAPTPLRRSLTAHRRRIK